MLSAIDASSYPTPALLTCIFFFFYWQSLECKHLTTLLHMGMHLLFSANEG